MLPRVEDVLGVLVPAPVTLLHRISRLVPREAARPVPPPVRSGTTFHATPRERQAAVELVALLPLVLAFFAGCRGWRIARPHSVEPASAAHAAARAEAMGVSPAPGGSRPPPARLERGLRLRASADGR